MTDDAFLADLTQARVIAIVRAADAAAAEAAGAVLLEAGFRFVEVALTTPDALGVIERLRPQAPPGVRLGAGTVVTPADVADVVAAGGQFIVTPAVTDSVEAAASRSLPSVVGALSPTEILSARARGADVVKLFPASVGGPRYVRAIRDPFPDIPLLAVGGVDLVAAKEYLRAGAVGVGVGGPLVGDAASGEGLEALRRRAQAFVALSDPGGS